MQNRRDEFAAVAYRLDARDEGYAAGARFRLDQLDGGQHFFRRLNALRRFASLHGLYLVNERDLKRLRNKRS